MKLHVKNAIKAGRILGLQQSDSDIVNGNAGGGFSITFTVVGMAMQNEIGPMAIDDLGEARGAKKRINLMGLAFDGCGAAARFLRHRDTVPCRFRADELDGVGRRHRDRDLPLALR